MKNNNITRITAEPGKQEIVIELEFDAPRDGMLQSGMERGVNDSHDRLDELLEKMQKEQPSGQKGLRRAA
jgi:hypothetical protein